MKEFLIVSILVSTLFLSEGLIYGSTFFEKEVDLNETTNISLEKEVYKDLNYAGEKVTLNNEEKKLIENYALKYRERATFLDLGANIDGFKEIGNERYYQITLYSKSVKGNDLTGAVNRILINKKGDVLKGENGEPLSGIEGLITNLNISNNEIIELENIARNYEAKLNNKDLEVDIWGEKEINGKIYYGVNIYSNTLKKEGIFEPLEKLYINKSGEVIRNTEA
ncbi:hypothetical protein QTH27_02105 [Clostridium perfringens]|uniref:hypothetical protein n=1 Tax=Clostridium perfringens TaxID=1502 RepID=UPI000BBB0C0A|nr:hypothetical protein [Clostridium perfringens]MDM0475351.1 hypothetical protein [Clostridium perfringens]MDM0476571.1 hypothetical protein [Clostridium perfringens]MDM0482975.1 hypothetical protein [Clostridium perfringens]MDM0485288.1 hypothetical protein [Clostridium perfringens]MDM0489216.1 hypothetical protein [Clostridium perfringens]